jgi:hypothetical protein
VEIPQVGGLHHRFDAFRGEICVSQDNLPLDLFTLLEIPSTNAVFSRDGP